MEKINPFPLAIWLMFVVWFVAGYFIGGALQTIWQLNESIRNVNYGFQYRDFHSPRNDER